jgi:hypothetical protein
MKTIAGTLLLWIGFCALLFGDDRPLVPLEQMYKYSVEVFREHGLYFYTQDPKVSPYPEDGSVGTFEPNDPTSPFRETLCIIARIRDHKIVYCVDTRNEETAEMRLYSFLHGWIMRSKQDETLVFGHIACHLIRIFCRNIWLSTTSIGVI